jgi:hypothetical protein
MRESAASGCLPGRASISARTVGAAAVFAAGIVASARLAAAAPPPEPDGDPRQPAVQAEASTIGRVNYAAARAEVPLAPHAALLPTAELLYLAPVAGDPDTESELHPQLGAGVAFERGADLDLELAFSYGPRAAGVASFGLSADASWGLGAGSAPSQAAPIEVDASLNVVRFVWSDGPGAPSSGPAVTQVYGEGSALLRLASDLYLRGRAMLFVYDGAITPADTDEVLRLGILARVGTYAPRGLAGARFTWRAHREIAPLVEANEIVYAGGVGSGSELEAGARVDFRGGARFTLAAGVLHNHLRGVAAELPDPRTVPIVKTSFEVSF